MQRLTTPQLKVLLVKTAISQRIKKTSVSKRISLTTHRPQQDIEVAHTNSSSFSTFLVGWLNTTCHGPLTRVLESITALNLVRQVCFPDHAILQILLQFTPQDI